MQTIWFVLCFLVLFFAFFLVKKSTEVQNGVIWGIMTFVTVLMVQAVSAAVINLFGVPINVWSIGLINSIIGVGIWVYILHKKERQQYYLKVIDIIAVICLIVLTVFVSIQQFGTGIHFNYESVDGGTHFRMALEVLQNQSVSKIFFAPLNNALFLELFMPFCKASELYHYYIIVDCFAFFGGGICFYAVIRNLISSTKTYLIGIFVTLLYVMGYPRNTLIYGFNYLNVAIVIVLFLMWAMEIYFEEKVAKDYVLAMLLLGTLSLGVCYSLFVPVIYVAIALAIFRKQWHVHKNINICIRNAVIDNLKIFLLPTSIVLYYSLFGFFGTSNTGSAVASGISNEGGVYRDLFSNFIFWCPLVIYALIIMFQKKYDDIGFICIFLAVVFTMLIGIEVILGKASTYYYYKNYNLLYVIVFYLAFCGIVELLKVNWQIVASYLGVYCMLLLATIGHIEARIQAKNGLLVPTVKSNYLFDIYEVNRILLDRQEDYSSEKIDIYQYCYDHFSQEEYEKIAFFGSIIDYNIFRGVTTRLSGDTSIFINSQTTDTTSVEAIFDDGYQNLTNENSQKNSPMILMCQNYDDRENIKNKYNDEIQIVYENSCGFIAVKK